MQLYSIPDYLNDVKRVGSLSVPWEQLRGKSIMLSGATGLIGSFLVDVLLEKDLLDDFNCTVYILGRNELRAKARFSKYTDSPFFVFIPYDVNLPLKRSDMGTVDFVLHLASNTHPLQYSNDPIGTITTNIVGLMNMLDFSIDHHATRFAFASSNEIYGENRGDVELFREDYCGYINSNTMRAGYPESKRCGEALCQAYKAQHGLDVVIPRLTRSYGPTMLMSDSKAISQFIKKGLEGKDIVLKSAGTQYYSYTYVADAVSGLLYTLLCGKNGEAYNIADESGDITLKDLATIIARISGNAVVFEYPDEIEAAGYSTATKARLDGHKLRGLGWKPKYDITSGMQRTMRILKEMQE